MLFCPALWNIAQYYPEVQAVDKINNWNNQESVFTELIKMIPATVPFIPMVKVDNGQWHICAMAQKNSSSEFCIPLVSSGFTHPQLSPLIIQILYNSIIPDLGWPLMMLVRRPMTSTAQESSCNKSHAETELTKKEETLMYNRRPKWSISSIQLPI